MAFAPLTSRRAFIGYDIGHLSEAGTTMDAANEAAHLIGQIITSDGGSHTLIITR